MTEVTLPAANVTAASIAATPPAAPAASPVALAPVSPAVAAPVPALAAPTAVVAPVAEAPITSFLGTDPVKSPAKAAEPVKAVEPVIAPVIKSEDGGQSEQSAQLPVYKALKLPDGMKPDGEGLMLRKFCNAS